MVVLREEWLSANGPCKQCGSADDLHVHHVDPSAKISHAVWSWSEVRRLEELAKCIILCAPCHRKVHHSVTHGITGYEYHHCRCDVCRAAKSEKNKRRIR